MGATSPLVEARSVNQSCSLGDPHTTVWPGRPPGIAGRFETEGRIVFDERPRHPWEFMATGTGVTGLTVTVDRSLRIQLNHASSFDESATQRTLGVLRIDGEGQPFATSDSIWMEHDLRRSVIEVIASGGDGLVRVQVRAHVLLDVIRIDVIDERARAGPLTMVLEKDYPHQDDLVDDKVYLSWHTNHSSVYEAANAWSGFDMEEDGRDLFHRRCFGTAMRLDSEGAKGLWSAGHLTVDASERHTLWIAGASRLGSTQAWRETVIEQVSRARATGQGQVVDPDPFIAGHEAWWREFWARSYFEPQDEGGRFACHRASFELYRYYVACCSSDRREVPVRFQNDLFRYDVFLDRERVHVRSLYLRTDWRCSDRVRLDAAYEYDRDDDDEFHMFRLGVTCKL